MRNVLRRISLLRRTYKNWLAIWLYEFTKRRRNVAEATLRIGVRVQAVHGHRFNNLLGLAQLLQDGWKILQAADDYVVLGDSESSIRMKCRTDVGYDLSFLAFVFVEKIYRTGFAGKTVLDAGSYTGDTAVYFAANGAAKVIGLEPDGANLALALQNVNEMNHLANRITLIQAALSTDDGQADFRIFEDEPNGNRMARYSDGPGTIVSVRTVTIDTVMREFGLERLDILKMNCEGAEYDIIESLTQRTAPLIDEIYVEFHRGPKRLTAMLEKLGYRVTGEKRDEVRYGHLRAQRVASSSDPST